LPKRLAVLLAWWVSTSLFFQDPRSKVYSLGIPTSGRDLYGHFIPSFCALLVKLLFFHCIEAQILQAILAVSASQSAVIDLFERIENFFIRLGTYVELPPTVEMTDIIVKVMVDVLLILALVTREIKQGKISGFILDERPFPFQLIIP
jgi:hypothetical protein